MSEIIRVAVDAMGGDNAPGEIVKGAIDAVNLRNDIKVLLVGREEVVNQELAQYTYNREQIKVIHASEIIETAEPPVMAIRKKKDSSIVVAMNLVKKGEADAFVSAGNTGALHAGSSLLIRPVKGVQRSGIATLLPFARPILMMDCGANTNVTAEYLEQWAVMGSIYMKNIEITARSMIF